MTKEKNDKDDSWIHFPPGYGWQMLAAPLLAAVLLGIFFWFFGYDSNLLWINVLVLAIWLLLALFVVFRRAYGELWRNYRWIIAPAVLILLFLFDTSWAQSTLATSSLEKSVFEVASLGSLQFHAEHPSQILFDDTEPSEIRLWVTGPLNCTNLVISGEGLLFAVKPSSNDSSTEWSDKLSVKFGKETNAVTLLVQPSKPVELNSQLIQLKLDSNGKSLETSDWLVNVENKRDSQTRGWKKNFLATSSTIISLITAIFVGIKQLEEEKKRQKIKQIEQAMASFDSDVTSDFTSALKKQLELTAEWNEWDRALQEQFRKSYSSSLEKNLWKGLSSKPTAEIASDVESCIQICGRIFESEQEKPIPVLKQLQSALRQNERSSRELLTMLRSYPAGIIVAKQIVSAFSPDLKRKIVAELAGEFPDQIRALSTELDFPDTESFPLQKQFAFYTKTYIPDDRLTAWLRAHELGYSPFADADNPFHSLSDKKLLMDLVAPGFTFPAPDFRNTTFGFSNAWDVGAGLFDYCKALQSNIKIKEEAFFAVVTPSLIENYGMDHPQKMFLRALAEQWIWSFAESPTLSYSLNDIQRDLLGRLLRWYDLSPSITANKAIKYVGSLHEEKSREIFSGIIEWLNKANSTDLRAEEVNALINLRPSPKQKTLFLISTNDLNPRVEKQLSSQMHERFSEQADWLSSHNCGLIHFSLGAKNRKIILHADLVNQCNGRVQSCSKNKLFFNQLFDAPGEEPDAILAQKARGSLGKMVRLGQKLLLDHVEKYSLDELLHIEDLIALK